MAYVDIENKDTRFRVLMTNHRKKIKAEQVPNNCTGILLEATSPSSRVTYGFLTGSRLVDSNASTTHYQGLRLTAKSYLLPLIAAEPIYNSQYTPSESGVADSYQNSGSNDRKMALLGMIADLACKIDRNNDLINKIDQITITSFSSKYLPFMHLRELLISQSAAAFAAWQRQEGIEPYLVVAAGITHIKGLISALEQPQADRLRDLLENRPDLEKYFDPTQLACRFYVKFHQQKRRFIKFTFTDEGLRQALEEREHQEC